MPAQTTSTDTTATRERVAELESQIHKDKAELAKLRRALPPESVADYTFTAHDGSEIALSELFGDKSDLILVHNMGRSCPYCTLWADGFTGSVKHLQNRTAFVVVSKDDHATQRDFYNSRGWNFPMVSSVGTTFNRDMGYEAENGNQRPGVSGFHKNADGSIVRIAQTAFGPGDDFCAVWPMLDLLKDGPDGWQPRFSYSADHAGTRPDCCE